MFIEIKEEGRGGDVAAFRIDAITLIDVIDSGATRITLDSGMVVHTSEPYIDLIRRIDTYTTVSLVPDDSEF